MRKRLFQIVTMIHSNESINKEDGDFVMVMEAEYLKEYNSIWEQVRANLQEARDQINKIKEDYV